ncbi:MAG TPA: aminotransferase class I/II-fold pyridoxal phosphate-dependent enzyme [Gemmatimonadales bacterium]|nr:aminotransferase class I/II-fold pyridoxal phosphate-dependent enzyme [Gemmatimonadales bacterium]
MALSRRSFLATLGAGGVGVLAAPHLGWRGHEALLAQGAAARRADRLLAARPGVIRLDSNENPNGPGERVYAVIRRHLSEANRYPVRSEDDLAAAIARVHGIQPENIILGSGSGELLRAAVSAFTSRDRALLSPEPTFEAPAAWAKFIGAPVFAPRVDAELRLDFDAMVKDGRGAGLSYLCNPNNPTATVHSRADVTAYVDRVGQLSPETTILIDEAYHEYVDEPSYGTAIPLALANSRVVVTRTFSKVFGMAGLRVGYAVGQPATLAKMAAWLLGSNVSQLSLVAAAATVGDTRHIALEQRRNRATRAYTREFFEGAGFRVARSDANFMMVDIRRDAKEFKLACIKRDVAVGRQFTSLPTWVRVSVGTLPEMKKALQVFRTMLA